MSDLPSVRMLATGVWPESAVRVTQVASTRRLVPEVEAAIDLAWREATSRPGVRLFDGPVCRLESFAIEGDTLALVVSTTSYRINVGTNFCNPGFADRFGPDVMANPIGVSAAVVSADGFVLFGRRNGSVAYYPHRLHPFAGSLEVRPSINLFDDVRRELREELHLAPADVASIACVGIAEDRSLRHPEALFVVRSTLPRAALQQRVDPEEHGSSEAFAGSEIESAIARADVTPIGQAALLRTLAVLRTDLSRD